MGHEHAIPSAARFISSPMVMLGSSSTTRMVRLPSARCRPSSTMSRSSYGLRLERLRRRGSHLPRGGCVGRQHDREGDPLPSSLSSSTARRGPARCARRSRGPGPSLPAGAPADRRPGRTSGRCACARARSMPPPLSLTEMRTRPSAAVALTRDAARLAAVLVRVREQVHDRVDQRVVVGVHDAAGRERR